MNKEQSLEDLREMISADAQHLAEAILAGDRVQAHTFLDAVIDNRRQLEDLLNS